MKKSKWKQLFTDKGFYISLATGIVSVVAFVVICLNMTMSTSPKEVPKTNQLAEQNQATATPGSSIAASEHNIAKKVTEDEPKAIEKPKATKKPVKKAVTTNVTLNFSAEKGLLWPVDGEIMKKYSADKAIYFETLAQYKTNPALIIGCKEGDKVVSGADAKVLDVAENDETGMTITTSIGSNYQVIYGQLKNIKVKKGDIIKEGQALGVIAKPSNYYVKESANLYLKVMQNDQSIDPLLLLR